MALCSLPRSNPGNRTQYKRVKRPLYLNHVCNRRFTSSLTATCHV